MARHGCSALEKSRVDFDARKLLMTFIDAAKLLITMTFAARMTFARRALMKT
jgi:hypothetical protein